MEQFVAFIGKEFRHIFRDLRTLLILIGMPIVQIILFGFAITTEVNNIDVAILVTSQDAVVQKIEEHLEASHYFNVIGTLAHPSEIERILLDGSADIVLVVENECDEKLRNFEKTTIQLIADATDPNTAIIEVNYAASLIQQAYAELGAGLPRSGITTNVRMLYNPQMKSSYNFVPGVIGLILILICAMMTSVSIVREKETGTMELLLVSPIKPIYIILSKAIPYFVISCINVLIILLLSVFVLDVPVVGSLVWIVILSILYIAVCLSLGLFISSIARTQMAAMLISGALLMMPAILLSGMIYPIENMPNILGWLSAILPTRWYIVSMRKLMIQGLGFSYVWKEVVILSLMAVCLIVLSIRKFKLRLQ